MCWEHKPGQTQLHLQIKDFESKNEVGQCFKWFQNYPWNEMIGILQLGLTVKCWLVLVSNNVKVFLAIQRCDYNNPLSRFSLLMFSLNFLPIFPQHVESQAGVAWKKILYLLGLFIFEGTKIIICDIFNRV